MPDLLLVFCRRWKFIVSVALAAALMALFVALISPKKYLSTATALPANSLVSDRSRLFHDNIQILYSDFGTPDELDRLEGTGMLDTIFIATSRELSLEVHYGITDEDDKPDGPARAAVVLKKNTSIARSGYGELKIKVWDGDKVLAAAMANSLMEQIQLLHQHLQQQGNALTLQRLQEDVRQKEDQYRRAADSTDTLAGKNTELMQARKAGLLQQVQEEQKLVSEYSLAISTNPQALLTVERARPALWPDRPKIVPTALFTLGGAFIFAFLVALFIESRHERSV